ncbi:HIV Tat-specific factor 1 homolog [Anthonomus grandis grandis]|uniref:HIV Tat-specific factor 1 homolog n=1 Tax=Anthonomus grandis grandis TaxID=2921223 RepID=UPI002165BDB0|nr:HIV Tat-specific factor 1 homolog [Anthonomus grandis grandis]
MADVSKVIQTLSDIPKDTLDLPENASQISNIQKPTCDQQYDTQDVHYEGDIAIYTDKATGYQYQWDKEKNEWVPKQNNITYDFEDDTHVYVDADGTKLFWDKEKKAWFPKLDDDFMAKYQMSYGFNNEEPGEKATKPEPPAENEVPTKPPKGEKRKASEPQWFELEETLNTNVYVSNLPTDISEQEFIDFMQKCGLVMRDPVSGHFKVKLYREPGTGYLKGDALCTYIKVESVELALKLLDGYEFKGKIINVERARFEMKGEYDPKLKPKMRKKKDKLKLKKQQEKLFDWRPEKKENEKSKHERVVIIKNLFDPTIFDKDVGLILEFQEDLREEAGKIGEVRKVLLYDRHPEGVAQITMASPEEATQVVTVLNGRWFMKRQLTAEIWDGKTKFKIAETDSEINQRLEKWDKFLEQEDGDEKSKDNKNNEDNSKTNSLSEGQLI